MMNAMRLEKMQTRKRLLKQVDLVKDQIIDKIKPQKIILFGSLARNEEGMGSDIDLMVIKDSEKSFKARMNELYDAVDSDEAVDMFFYTNAELDSMKGWSSFIRKALSEGTVLYEA